MFDTLLMLVLLAGGLGLLAPLAAPAPLAMASEGPPATEAECRAAIAAGITHCWNDLGNLLVRQPGRERRAEAA